MSEREQASFGIACFVLLVLGAAAFIAVKRLHIRPAQLVEGSLYLLAIFATGWILVRELFTRKQRLEENWPQLPVVISTTKDNAYVARAMEQNSIVLGYDVHKKPVFWSDEIRRMQSLVLGMSGSGKTTLLYNIIAQDLHRVVGPPDAPHRIPIIIVDGKGDQEFLDDLLYEVAAAARMHQLRIIDPSRPEISARWNPLYIKDGDSYQDYVNAVVESFGQRRDFFKGHQATYFNDLVCVLYHTGKVMNMYDVLVTALDPKVLREQIQEAASRLSALSGTSEQRQLNFEMSAKNLLQSLYDRDRVPKIQGLLNELMTFLEDDLSKITGSYNGLLTIEDVIEQELVLVVSLNTNRNSRAMTALGRMLLQNMQLVLGKRYDKSSEYRPFVSVVLDEFAPFAYPNFAQILHTARGANAAFLFSLQSIPQLETVSPGFRDNVSSAPNTVMLLRTRDEDTAQYFEKAGSKVKAMRTSTTVQSHGIFRKQYKELNFHTQTPIDNPLVPDDHIKNQPTGQMELLMTGMPGDEAPTVYKHVHVRRASKFRLGDFKPEIYLPTGSPLPGSEGANLRFKDPELMKRNPRISGRRNREQQ